MKVEGFNDNQGRPIYQPLVVNQNGREILYLGNLAGNILNPLTGKVEPNGTSIIDVTDVKSPKFLFHIPGPAGTVGNAGAQMVRVCSGDTLRREGQMVSVTRLRQCRAGRIPSSLGRDRSGGADAYHHDRQRAEQYA
jgi:hypothetical protein